jgi:PPK2 family polyphosphate:nucleotide phosphotransferase
MKVSGHLLDSLIVPPGQKISLERDFDPCATFDHLDKKEAAALLEQGIAHLAESQNRLYAQRHYALLIVLQAMDAAGKDGTIKHVMSGINPQGCQVFSFKEPSDEELDHDYLWRSVRALPERGRIGIFNRSYYEEVIVVRVHPELLARERVPSRRKDSKVWSRRFDEINNFERYLTANGIVVLKFFLNISKAEQRKRLLRRIAQPERNWKLSPSDVRERRHWDEYRRAYEDCFNHTSTSWAPWHIVPADNKWMTRLAVAEIIVRALKRLKLSYPEADPALLKEAKGLLTSEK